MSDLINNLRNAELHDLAQLLMDQQARKVDTVVPAAKMRSENGVLVVEGSDVELSPEGVTTVDGRYLPTAICDEGVADKLGVPLTYVRRLRNERPDLYDANVNGWLHGADGETPDARSFLLRGYTAGETGGPGVARALLSTTYKRMDNLDVLTAALAGAREAGADLEVVGCDLTERKMQVRISAPGITALAPTLLAGYRSPFDNGVARAGEPMTAAEARWREHSGYGRGEEPIVFAGLVLSNSETGGGAFTIVPRIMVKVCTNGLVVTKDAVRSVHLGTKLEDGVVNWSADTMRKELELVSAKARDAVASFLNVTYMEGVIRDLEAKAGAPVADAAATVERVGKALRFSEAETASVLDHFIRGGQLTAGGVLNAVTSAAQTIVDADRAADVEAQGIQALELAAL